MKPDPANPEPRKALEQAIGKIAKAYNDLLRVAEKHGDDISSEDYKKAQFFLSNTMGKIWEKIDVVRDIAKATSGDFSLDSIEMPEALKVQWYMPNAPQRPQGIVEQLPIGFPDVKPGQPIDTSQMDGRSLAKAIGGRLSKFAQRETPRPQPSVNIDLYVDDGLGAPDTSDDSLVNEVDFIDDK